MDKKTKIAERPFPDAGSEAASGFTLIELAIVLVIIGLIVGGILVGQNLIETAGARHVMTQLNQYQVAANTFVSKYNCKPGDCSNATAFGIGPDGDGDGVLDGFSVVLDGLTSSPLYLRTEGEEQWFFVHLAAAGMIAGSYTALMNDTEAGTITSVSRAAAYFPIMDNGNGFITSLTWNGQNYLRTGWQASGSNMGPYASATGSVTGNQMGYIVSKFGYSAVVDCTTGPWCGMPSEIGHQAIPVGVYPGTGTGNEYYIYMNPADVHNQVYCVDTTVTPPRFDTTHGVSCNILWKLDY